MVVCFQGKWWNRLGYGNSVKSEESGPGWFFKNNKELVLVAVRTSKSIMSLKNSRKLKKTGEKKHN